MSYIHVIDMSIGGSLLALVFTATFQKVLGELAAFLRLAYLNTCGKPIFVSQIDFRQIEGHPHRNGALVCGDTYPSTFGCSP